MPDRRIQIEEPEPLDLSLEVSLSEFEGKTPDDQELRARFLEWEKNNAAETTGCLGTGIAILVGFYVVLTEILPHVPQWLGLLAMLTALVGPQIAFARWEERQAERNREERIRSERERRAQEETK